MTSREKSLLAIFILATMIVAGYFIDVPAIEKMRNNTQQLKNFKQVQKEKQVQVDDLKQAKIEIAQSQKKLEELSDSLPTEKEIPDLLRSLETIASKSGMKFETINVGSVSKGAPNQADIPKVQSIPIGLVITGSKTGLKSYLKQIEQYKRIIDVATISSSDLDNTDVQYILDATVYYVD